LQCINPGDTSVLQSLGDRFPADAWKSASLFGVLGLAIAAQLTLPGFYILGINETSPASYAIFKRL
jgi:hypothetical protein